MFRLETGTCGEGGADKIFRAPIMKTRGASTLMQDYFAFPS